MDIVAWIVLILLDIVVKEAWHKSSIGYRC